MKRIRLAALCTMLLLPTIASAASDMYLKIKGVDGETTIVHCPDGACVVDSLAAGKYSVLVSDQRGKVIPSNITLTYSVTSPRDAASGMATGKRMHKPIRITKEWDKRAAPGNQLEVDEAGAQVLIGVSEEAVEAAAAKVTKTRSNIQNN